MRGRTPDRTGAAEEGRRRRPHARRGFTLLEVILAVSLFAVSVVVLAASYINILNALDAVQADISLEQELAFVRSRILSEPDLEEVEKGGQVPTATHGEARWYAEVFPTDIADLFRVELEIELEEGPGSEHGEPRTIEQTLYVLRPTWSDPVERDKLRALARERIEEARRYRLL
ncbi:MAG: prepilin-type N-terminal cleavage/methylation domain-containing protein [Verrucomicrobia bacterium]|nr:MAG: prepilin-type N-terminal cleavage/methylation domain-containing protein [Verrucomicrobiota bacterium]